jgi:hypothetical protein
MAIGLFGSTAHPPDGKSSLGDAPLRLALGLSACPRSCLVCLSMNVSLPLLLPCPVRAESWKTIRDCTFYFEIAHLPLVVSSGLLRN